MIQPDSATGFARITYVLPGAPAEKMRLQVGDMITAVNGKPTKGLSGEGISSMCAANRVRSSMFLSLAAALRRW